MPNTAYSGATSPLFQAPTIEASQHTDQHETIDGQLNGHPAAVETADVEAVPLADDEAVDPRIRAIAGASLPDRAKTAKRRELLSRLIEDRQIFLDPDHLGFVRYILNFEEFKDMLPRKVRGDYRYPVPPLRLSDGTLVYYADAVVPSLFPVQQLANYRTHAARSLTAKATARNPVSRPYGVQIAGDEMAAMCHDYYATDQLEKALRHAHEQVKTERSALNGWEPLLSAVQADGVTDGGLWMQTIFRAIDEHGHPTGIAHATLAPADGASRKAVNDHTLDRDGLFAAVPIATANRSHVFGPNSANAESPATVAETVMEPINQVKKALGDIDPRPRDLEDLDDDIRARLNTATIRIRIVIAVRTPDKRFGALSGPDLFIRTQDHFHTDAHLNHSEISSERLRADKVRAALADAYASGELQVAEDSDRVEWTPELLAAMSNECDYSALPQIGLPFSRVGAAIAAYLLVTGDGPERSVVGAALGSRRNGGAYDNVLSKKRTALLRELIYPDVAGINGRVFENLEISAAFNRPHHGFDGDIPSLYQRYADRIATDWERGLLETLGVIRALDKGMHVVDLGSQGKDRGWLRAKMANAVHGSRVLVDKDDDVYVEVNVPAGAKYVEALVTGTLLSDGPVPAVVESGPLPHPTTQQWAEWAASGVGLLDDAGNPILQTRVAVEINADGNPLIDESGEPVKVTVEVPKVAPTSLFDAFSNARMKERALALHQQGYGISTVTPGAQERFDKAADDVEENWQKVQDAFDVIHDLVADGLALDPKQRARLEAAVRNVRVSVRPDAGGIADLLDTIVVVSEQNETTAHAVNEHGYNDQDGEPSDMSGDVDSDAAVVPLTAPGTDQ